jgi:hypothetical protein
MRIASSSPNPLIQARALPLAMSASIGKVRMGGRASPDRGRWTTERDL